MLKNASPKNTPKRPFFEVEFLISLYRIAKGAWKIRESTPQSHSENFPEIITVVMDNLNTHGPASFYEAFEPDEARRLSQRFDFHYTPKHGSWLNMAEAELSVLARQCLARRIPDQHQLKQEVSPSGRKIAMQTAPPLI